MNSFDFANVGKRYSVYTGVKLSCVKLGSYPANIYLFKVTNRNTRKRCGICYKLTRKTPERRQ